MQTSVGSGHSAQYGSGIVRTGSGRQTYAPDGIADHSNEDVKSTTDDGKDSDGADHSNDEEKDVEKGDSKKEKSGDDDDEQDPNVVDWDGPDDKENPMNFPTARKWIMAVSMGSMTLVVTFASSVFSSATQVTAQQFGVSEIVMILGLALFVLGFAFGPIIWVSSSRVSLNPTALANHSI
jgi:hypothetical protein